MTGSRTLRPGRTLVRGLAAAALLATLAVPPLALPELPATEPAATCLAGRRLVFENLDHDIPQRIICWIDEGGSLCSRVEGTVDGKRHAEEWRWSRLGG